jgi:hypothetical protein
MIPSDFTARLRLLNESTVQPLAAVHEIAAELPDFRLGQRFTARIEAALPDGSFRALVAGKSLTLALPQSAKAGDTLDLVVVDRTPRLIVAGRADAAAAAAPPPAASLSRGGQIISTLLAGGEGGEGAAPAAQLLRSAPLLAAPPSSAAPLAPALQQAMAESGLFYEAHQAQWIAGRLPLETLLREPQGRHSRALAPAAPAASGAARPGDVAEDAVSARPIETRPAPGPASLLPADLQPLVQQQLDAASTQQILWRGEVWPGQTMQWEIEEETARRGEGPEEEAARWNTSIRLILPQLGELAAVLHLTPAGVSIDLTAAQGASLAALRDGQAELSGALAAAGVPLLAMKLERHDAE